MNIPFYDDYFALQYPENEQFKTEYIRARSKSGNIYKYVAINDDDELNIKKIEMLAKGEFWASHHIYFQDDREVFRKFDLLRVAQSVKWTPESIEFFFNAVDEMNNISCFSYEISDDMWNDYANGANGFCLELEMTNSNFFFPVVYLDKDKLDMTDDICLSFKSTQTSLKNEASLRMAILPWVLKDAKYHGENELRFLCGEEYDDENGIMGGRLFPGKKRLMGIRGIPYSFEYAGLKLKRVYIGRNSMETESIIKACDKQNVPFDIMCNI